MIRINKDDTNYSVTFNPLRDSVGEKIIGEWFEVRVGKIADANQIPVNDPGAIEGDLTTNSVTFPIRMDALPERKSYSLVLRTEETGVIFKEIYYINEPVS